MITGKLEKLAQRSQEFGCKYFENEPMCKHTTFKIGGPADLFISVPNEKALTAIITDCTQNEIPFVLLGKGSNMLVKDQGIRGVVLHLSGDFASVKKDGKNELVCGAGASLASICAFARKNSLSGLEFAWGIPGSAGGAVFMNAGAYGGEMKDVLLSCRHITRQGIIEELDKGSLNLSYRHSVYTGSKNIILFMRLGLQCGEESIISSKMENLMRRRKDKQPVELPSAGSVFKRPQGYYAGSLIEQCGLKGASVGGAQVSPKHAGFIVNNGGATCEDVMRLVSKIQETVYKQTGVQLECEIRTVG